MAEDVIEIKHKKKAKNRLKGAAGAIRAGVRLQQHHGEVMFTPDDVRNALAALDNKRAAELEKKKAAEAKRNVSRASCGHCHDYQV